MKGNDGLTDRGKRAEQGGKGGKATRPRPTPSSTAAPAAKEKVGRDEYHWKLGNSAAPRCPPLRMFFPHDARYLLLGLAVAVLLFSNGFGKELVFDDLLAIERNADSFPDRGVSLKKVFLHDFWGHNLDDVSSNGSYRPLIILTFRLQYLLAGRTHSVASLHAFNFFFAYCNACLVYYVARLYNQMLVTVGRRDHSAIPSDPYGVPTLAMLIFVVHPVHVDAVTSIVGRCEVLCCLAGLLAFFAVHCFLVGAGNPARSCSAAAVKHGAGQLLLTVALLVLCVLFKDSGVTFTAVFIVHALLLLAWGFTTHARVAVTAALSVGFALGYFAFRRDFVGLVDLSKSRLLRRAENPQYFIPAGALHWLSMRWTIQLKNFELLFYPTKLCCEYSYNCIPHLESLQDERLPYYVGVTAALLVTIGALVWTAVVRKSRLAVLMLIFLLWIAIPYAPVSHLFVRVGTFIAERCLYVPSIGVALIYSFTAQPQLRALLPSPGSRGARLQSARLWGLLTLVALWFVISRRRNRAWDTNETLARASLEACPNSGKANGQVGTTIVAREKKITSEAVSYFLRAVQLDDEETAPLYYLAVYAWEELRDYKRAYDMIRVCTRSPFEVARCHPMYVQMRDALRPNMSQVDKLIDESMHMPLPSQAALLLRQAAMLQRSEAQDGACSGLVQFQTALHHWNASRVFWQSDLVSPEHGTETFCNTAYWWADTFEHCLLEPEKSTEDKKLFLTDEEEERRPALEPHMLQQAMHDIRMIADNCATNWAKPGIVRGAKAATILTYRNRLTEFKTLISRIKGMLAGMKPYLLRDEEKRLASVTALQLVVNHYCDFITILENADVKATLAKHFPEEIRHIDALAAENMGRLRREIVMLWKSIDQAVINDAAEAAAFAKHKGHLRELAKCSVKLSPIFV